MKYITTLLTLGLLFVFALAPAQAAQDEEEVIQTLKTTELARFEMHNEPLSNILHFLSDSTGVNFVMSPDLIEENPEVMDLSLRSGQSAYDVIKVICKLKDLSLFYKDGIVLVAGKNDKVNEPVLRVYNVTALQFETTDFEGPVVKLEDNDGFGPIVCEFPAYNESKATPDDIAELIELFTGAGSWEQQRSIEVKGSLLLVYQTPEVHQEIADLLQELQDMN